MIDGARGVEYVCVVLTESQGRSYGDFHKRTRTVRSST